MRVTEATTTIKFRHIYPGELTRTEIYKRLQMFFDNSPYNDFCIQDVAVESVFNTPSQPINDETSD